MNKLQANLCLICVTIIWSSELIVLSCVPKSVPPIATTCITKTIGAVLLFVCFSGRIISEIKEYKWGLIKKGIIIAALNCVYNTMVIVGFRGFDKITGNFVYTSTAVVMPFLLLVMGRKVSKSRFLTSALILVGIIIALTQAEKRISIVSLAIMLVACVIRALFITKMSDYAKENDPVAIAALMTLISGMISFVLWFHVDPATFTAVPWNKQMIASVFIDAYFIVGLSYVLNTFAQRKTTPMDAAMIYALEILFTLTLCMILPEDIVGNVRITALVIVAAGFILAGNLSAIIVSAVGKRLGTGGSSESGTNGEEDHVKAIGMAGDMVSDKEGK